MFNFIKILQERIFESVVTVLITVGIVSAPVSVEPVVLSEEGQGIFHEDEVVIQEENKVQDDDQAENGITQSSETPSQDQNKLEALQKEAELQKVRDQKLQEAERQLEDKQKELDKQEEENRKNQEVLEDILDEVEEIRENTKPIEETEEEEVVTESQARMEFKLDRMGAPVGVDNSYLRCSRVGILVALYDDAGSIDKESGVTLTTPDSSQNKTDDYANTISSSNSMGDLRNVNLYELIYTPQEAGNHTLTLTSGDLEKTVAIPVVDYPVEEC